MAPWLAAGHSNLVQSTLINSTAQSHKMHIGAALETCSYGCYISFTLSVWTKPLGPYDFRSFLEPREGVQRFHKDEKKEKEVGDVKRKG